MSREEITNLISIKMIINILFICLKFHHHIEGEGRLDNIVKLLRNARSSSNNKDDKSNRKENVKDPINNRDKDNNNKYEENLQLGQFHDNRRMTT